jgi:hypothetical protein
VLFAAVLWLLPVTLSALGTTSHLQLELGTQFAVTQVSTTGVDANAYAGDVSLAANVFFQPVVDDDAPLSLQPFLQRVSSLSLGVSGGGGSFDITDYSEQRWSAGANIGLDGYVHRNLALFMNWSVSVLDVSVPTPTGLIPMGSRTYRLPMNAGFGLRFADVRINLFYSIAPVAVNGSNFRQTFWYGVGASLFAVIDRRFVINARIDAADGGATAHAGLTVYLSRKLSVGGGVSGGQSSTFSNAGGDLGVAYWFSRLLGVGFSYDVGWLNSVSTGTAAYSNIIHTFSLNLFSRPR